MTIKLSKPKLLSLIAALIISGIITSVFAFYFISSSAPALRQLADHWQCTSWLKHPLGVFPAVLFIIAAFIFSVSSLVILYVIEKYIYKKIRKLHSDVKLQLADELSSLEKAGLSNDALENLNIDFQRWSQGRREEIARLNKLENYRKEFLGNVSHELKTPVFNIQGYILTLLDGGLEDKNINRDYLQRAEKSVERMITIIEDLESITQLEVGELQLEIEKFDISLLAKEVVDSLEMNAKEKGIKLILGKYDDAPIWVLGDKFRLRQVFLNLIVNSIKYGKENGETRINFRDAGEKIMIEVADNGIGIEKQHLPRIFERFYRIDKSRSREAGGTGLGLSIVEHIIEAHGQTISVLSTPGVGTVFSFSLKKAQ